MDIVFANKGFISIYCRLSVVNMPMIPFNADNHQLLILELYQDSCD